MNIIAPPLLYALVFAFEASRVDEANSEQHPARPVHPRAAQVAPDAIIIVDQPRLAAGTLGVRRLLGVEQLHIEDQRRVRRNHAASAARAIA